MKIAYLLLFSLFFVLGLFLSEETLINLKCHSVSVIVVTVITGTVLGFVASRYLFKRQIFFKVSKYFFIISAGIGLGSLLNSLFNHYSICFSLFYLMTLPLFGTIGFLFNKKDTEN